MLTRRPDATVSEALRSLEAVAYAWAAPGPFPRVHRRAQRALRRSWPTLAGALDLLAATLLENPEPR